jgi:hypothetical protein
MGGKSHIRQSDGLGDRAPRRDSCQNAGMHRRMVLPAVAVTALLLWSAPAPGEQSEIERLVECAQQNIPDSSVQTMMFRAMDRVGYTREIRTRVSRKRFESGFSKVFLRVEAPDDLRGAGMLLIEKSSGVDMFIYLPDLHRVKRVTSQTLSGSLFGSDFTYEDFLQVQGMALEGRHELLPDSVVDGVVVRVVAHHPAEASGSSYERVVSYWDPDSCITLKSEMWEPGGHQRKTLTVDRGAIFQEDGARIPQKLRMQDLRDQTSTDLAIEELEVNVKIPRKLFSTTSLERPRVR